jgi:hypothetical protein
MTDERSNIEMNRVSNLLQPIARPLAAAEAAPMTALIEAWTAGALSPTVLWGALRHARSLAMMLVSATTEPPASAEWIAVLQPLPGLGNALTIRRASDKAEVGFRLDGAGQPCGAIALQQGEQLVLLEIETTPQGARLRSFLAGREVVLDLGPVPAGCWTPHPDRRQADPALQARLQTLPGAFGGRPPLPSPGPRLLLVHLSGPARFDDRTISGLTLVGRGEGCDLQVLDPRMSRRHVQLEPTASGFQIKDAGSGGGTYLNGRLLTGPVAVEHGDHIVIGDTHIELRAIESAPAETRAEDTPTALIAEKVPDTVKLPPVPPAPPPAEDAGILVPPTIILDPPAAPPKQDPGAQPPAVCSLCQAPLTAGARFCAQCGKAVPT